jgi:hypothetical protein
LLSPEPGVGRDGSLINGSSDPFAAHGLHPHRQIKKMKERKKESKKRKVQN